MSKARQVVVVEVKRNLPVPQLLDLSVRAQSYTDFTCCHSGRESDKRQGCAKGCIQGNLTVVALEAPPSVRAVPLRLKPSLN